MGDPGEKKYIKKKIRPGAIVLDPRETAIVVQYELEGQLLAPDGVTVITELSDGRSASRSRLSTEGRTSRPWPTRSSPRAS